MLTQEGCRSRQNRLRERLDELGIDAVVLTDHQEIYYFTGLLLSQFPAFYFPAFMFLETSGGSWVAAHTNEGEAAVDDRVVYDWHIMYTLNPDPMRLLNKEVERTLGKQKGFRCIGWQEEGIPKLLSDTVARQLAPDAWVSIDDLLAELHKSKDEDEVALLRKSIQADLAAYSRVQQILEPGMNELDVLAGAQQAAMEAVGEVIYHGGDYQSGEFGGIARNRIIQDGEMYVIDAHSNYRGYWADLCRTYIVGGEPTDLQQSVYDHIAGILRDVPDLVKPGGSATELWKSIDARTREHPYLEQDGLVHHGGHGVGLRPHEAPDINRDREGVFEVGDVFSCEPGGYGKELKVGVRLENTFLVREDGIENLSEYPLNLVPRK